MHKLTIGAALAMALSSGFAFSWLVLEPQWLSAGAMQITGAEAAPLPTATLRR